mgnify:CR=1 FL=1
MHRSYTNSTLLIGSALVACLCARPNLAEAQNHYPGGIEGIKAASLPPPGFYLRDYNLVYFADRVNDAAGHRVPMDFSVTAYAQAIRPIWITDWQVLGGSVGLDVLVPFIYTDFKAGGYKDSAFGLGDICIEVPTISWHGQCYDFGVGYAIWAPTGEFDRTRPEKPGKGFWSHMLTAGGTWYPTEDKAWSLSVLNRYEIHMRDEAGYTPGNTLTTEFGIGRAVCKTAELGVIGYYQQQTTDDSGRGSKPHNRVFGVGPEISVAIPKWAMFISARYAREFGAEDTSEGNTVTVTLTKKL